MKKFPKVSIDLILEDPKGRILLGKVSKKWQESGKYLWGLPGREVAFGENLKECAKQNLKKELGMEMISSKVVCVNSNFGYGNHYVSIGILVKAKGRPINKRPEDWIEWKWFEKRKIPSKLFPSAKVTLKAFLKKKISLDFN